jgi:hypothetical protein
MGKVTVWLKCEFYEEDAGPDDALDIRSEIIVNPDYLFEAVGGVFFKEINVSVEK